MLRRQARRRERSAMRGPRSKLLYVAAATLLAINAHAEGNDVFPFPVHERTLANGLKVIVVPTGFPNLVSVQIPIMAGSRNEVEPGRSGFAHFFEHMMFRGTPANPPERYQAVMTRAGARDNAYTTDDYTNYHTTFAKEDLETILALDADRFQHLAYGEAAFKTESRAVLGEYNKNSANPIRKLLEVQRDHAFTTHTYKHTTMGFLKDIEDMPNQYEYSKTFFDRWYRPEYATLLVAGDVQPEEVFALAEKYWGSWRHGTYEVEIPAEPAPKGPVYAHVPWNAPGLPLVTVAFHGPAFSETEKDYAALDMLMGLSFGHTSELYQRLVVQEQTVDDLFP
jgi:zinc protease